MTLDELRLSTATAVTLTSIFCVTGCFEDGKGSDDGIGTASASASGTSDSTSDSATSLGTTSDGTGTSDSSSTTSDSASASASGTSDGTGGVKFDVGTNIDVGNTTGGGGVGSCRESEIYGAAGGFPKFTDPNYASFLDKTVAIVTHRPQYPLTNVMTVIDISGAPPPPEVNYLAPKYWDPGWTEAALGKIFGITLDSDGNIYVAASTVYGSNPTPNKIRKVDAYTGQISDFATLPNNGPAFGNLNYDCVSQTIYVSNHEDGRVYQLDMNGDVVSTYRHSTGSVTMGLPNDPGEPDGQFSALGDRVWAVQSHAGRLYYSVWWESSSSTNQTENNEIWSVGYVDQNGVPDPATAKKEFDVPANDGPNGTKTIPVSDLSFAHDGWMLIAQRTMSSDMSTSAHQSTTYDYDYDPMTSSWIWQGTNYVVGELMPYSAAGGVDHDFDPGGYVWMTGDALDFYTPDVVYGLQGTPYGGGDITNSTLIDLDEEITQQDKTVYGDVELPIPGDVAPVPPPG